MIRARGAASLRGRFLVLSVLWIAAALLGAWIVVGGVLDRFVTARFDAELEATSDAIVAGLEPDPAGEGAELAVPILDPRFARPLSGWYWQVSGARTRILSESLFLDALAAPYTRGPDGAPLYPVTRQVTIPGVEGPLFVAVTAPAEVLSATRGEVRRPLLLSLAALGAGLALLAAAQGALALGGFRHIGRGIAEIRAGRTERLSRRGLREVDAPVDEINALLDANREVLTRSRHHVGNLAHALKTPLAAILNAAPPDSETAHLTSRMDRLVRYHLRRARNAGTAHLLGARTPVTDVAEDIATVLRDAARRRGVSIGLDCPEDLVFAGEREDLEEILGNLAENAVAWAAGRVDISAQAVEGERLRLDVCDDGPGIPAESHAHVLSRGGRLDEDVIGSGLGLGIVADLVTLYDGRLDLGRAAGGGLAVSILLPRA